MNYHLSVTTFLMTLSSLAHAFDSFDSSTNTLSIPLVSVGSAYYKDVQVSVATVKSVGGTFTPSATPLHDALRLVYSTPQQSTFKYEGIMDGKSVSGSTVTTISRAQSTSFEGKNSYVVSRTRKNFDVNGLELTNSTTQVYLDTNYKILGEIDQYYRVITQSAIVSNVLVQTENIYETAAKQNLYAVNSSRIYAKIDPVDISIVWIYESGDGKDISGNLINTWTGVYSIDMKTGIISSEFYSDSGKSNTTIYFIR